MPDHRDTAGRATVPRLHDEHTAPHDRPAYERSAPVGFAGLGNLGLPMVAALVRDGWSVTVHDTAAERVRAAAAEGARPARSGRDLGSCRIVALAVPDDEAVEQVLVTDG
ncbi:MAG: NAD(P)-binding domain-containing protein, partial [Actinocatenispora sp.]